MTTSPIRNTRQRAAVAAALREPVDLRSAPEIHAALRAQGQRLGLTTVYRAVQAMADAGELDSIAREDGETVYRRCSTTHHHHLVCRSCGQAIEIEGPTVEAWATRIAHEHGFTDVNHTIEIFGTCPRCN